MDCFWEVIVDEDVDISWLVQVRNHLDKIEKEHAKIERKKLASLSRNSHLKRMVLQRFDEHLPHFQFKQDFLSYCSSLRNSYTLVTIHKTSKYPKGESASSQTCQDDINLTEVLTEEEKSNDLLDTTGNCSESGTQASDHQDMNTAFYKGLRLEGKFVSKNVFNLSRRNLSPPEISLLSKGLKFVPSANKIDRAKLKRELEEYGRKLRLMWHFRNDERTFTAEKFRPKSSFNPRNKDAIIETYLSCLEERLLGIKILSKRYNNLSKDERDAYIA